jgi:hypothetical protein
LPQAVGVRAYDRLFPVFQGLYPKLRPDFTALLDPGESS